MAKFSLKAKFWILFLVSSCTLIYVASLTFNSSRALISELKSFENTAIPELTHAKLLEQTFLLISRDIEDAMILGEEDLLDRFRLGRDTFLQTLDNLQDLESEEFRTNLGRIRSVFEAYYPEAESLATMVLYSENPELIFSADRFITRSQRLGVQAMSLKASLEHFNTTVGVLAEQQLMSAGERVGNSMSTTLLLIFGALIFLSIFLITLARGIVLPIAALSNYSADVAEGRFDYPFPIKKVGSDEIGKLANAFQNMVAGLKQSTVSTKYVDEIIESMPDGLIVTDESGSIELVNKRYSKLVVTREWSYLVNHRTYFCKVNP